VRPGKVLLFTVIGLIISNSCSKNGGRSFYQGEIHYDVTYEGVVTNMPIEIMPKSLVVTFKGNNIMYELISPIGNSGIINLSNPSKDIYDTYLSLFTIRYFYPSKPGEIYPGFESMEGLEIKKTSKTTEICGFKCNNAEVTFPADRSKIYEVWYTNEIPVCC
jgi:GLPGLI family protein